MRSRRGMSLRRWVFIRSIRPRGNMPWVLRSSNGGNRPARRPQFCHQIPGGVESEQVYPCGTAQRRAAHPSFHHARTDRAGRCARIRTCAAPLSGVFRLNIRGCLAPGFGSWNAEGQGALSAFLFCAGSAKYPRRLCFLRIMSKGHTNMSFKNIFAGRFRLILEPDTDIKFFNPEIV